MTETYNQKSKMYYATRSVARVAVKVLILLAAYAIIHVATYNIWTALLFIALLIGGIEIYQAKKANTASE